MTAHRNITGEQMRLARTRSRLTIREFAVLLDTHNRTVSNWLADGVPPRAEAHVREVLGGWLDPEVPVLPVPAPPQGIRAYSDVELLGEVWRRLDEARSGGNV